MKKLVSRVYAFPCAWYMHLLPHGQPSQERGRRKFLTPSIVCVTVLLRIVAVVYILYCFLFSRNTDKSLIARVVNDCFIIISDIIHCGTSHFPKNLYVFVIPLLSYSCPYVLFGLPYKSLRLL